jgi:hypothetical protein
MVPDELARLLCDVWLRQVFQGTMLPVNIRPENILLRSPTEIAFVDGSIVSFPAASRRNLLNYFISVATDEPSKALACLMKELDSTHSTISETALDRQFREPSYWGGQMDRLASLIILGPQHLDDALKAMSDEEPTSQESIPTRQVSNHWNLLLISLLAVVTSYAFREQLANLVTPIWAERLSALVFIVSGGLFLRWMTRHGD